jgi:resuscitation-promoting factor RpfB
MSNQFPHRPQPVTPSRKIPATTWIGIIGTGLLALIGLASGGLWSMLLMIALVVLITAVYGTLFRRTTWLRLPRKRAAAAIGAGIALVVLVGSSSAYGATHATTPSAFSASSEVVSTATPTTKHAAPKPTRAQTPTPTPSPTPVITEKLVTDTVPVPFASTQVQSANLAKGTSSITTTGVNGVKTRTYTVTYTDGVETGRSLTSETVTTPPVTQVTTVGTYVAPAAPAPAQAPAPAPAPATCTNGSYVNSAGNTVCRPAASADVPAGATAKCVDGVYSFSQSRRGTCSGHGGVATWL